MKRLLFIFCLMISFIGFSQHNIFYDFIVLNTKDTVYGHFQKNKFIALDSTKFSIDKNLIKTIKKNDLTYQLQSISKNNFYSIENDSLLPLNTPLISAFKMETSLYLHNIAPKLRKDYTIHKKKDSITINIDTVYGKIKIKNNSYHQIVDGKTKKIFSKNIPEFRMRGFSYFYKQKRKVSLIDKNAAYLKLIYNNTIKLYEYQTVNLTPLFGSKTNRYYYIEKENTLTLITPNRFFQIMEKLFPENVYLLEKIKLKKWSYKDIFAIVKYLNNPKLFEPAL